MIVLTDSNLRSLRGAAASAEGREKVTELLAMHRGFREKKGARVAEIEQLLEEQREELAQSERNIALIESVLSEVAA